MVGLITFLAPIRCRGELPAKTVSTIERRFQRSKGGINDRTVHVHGLATIATFLIVMGRSYFGGAKCYHERIRSKTAKMVAFRSAEIVQRIADNGFAHR